jgi:peptidoglycan/LPS O-acetylase OafA/YrhL
MLLNSHSRLEVELNCSPPDIQDHSSCENEWLRSETLRASAVSLTRHVGALDGIRGLAVLLVLLFHFGDLSQSSSRLLRVLNEVKGAGWIGVDMFFALSGFLITGILWQTRNDTDRAKNFYSRRALRLFPLFYGVWAILFAWAWHTHQLRPGYWLYLLYIGNFAAPTLGSLGIFGIAHFWSLAVEEQFYFIWPWVVWRVNNFRRCGHVLLGVLIVSLFIRIILIVARVNPLWIYDMLPTHADALVLGAFGALAIRDSRARVWCQAAKWALPVSWGAVVLLGVWCGGLNFRNPWVQLVGYPLLGLGSVSLILQCLTKGTITERVMSNSCLRFYGKYSYGLYVYSFLLHDGLRSMVYLPLRARVHYGVATGVIYLGISIALLTALSMASYHYYELPFLRMKRYFQHRQTESCTGVA